MQYVGYLAAVCTTIAFVPQALKTLKDKDTSGISLSMYSIFTVGVLCWLIYGISIQDVALASANAVTLIFAIIILTMKIKYK